MRVAREAGQGTGVRRPVQWWAVVGFFVFMVVGLTMALPCLCMEGAIVGRFTTVLYAIVVLRVGCGVLERNLTKWQFAIWVGGFLVFVAIAEWAMGHH